MKSKQKSLTYSDIFGKAQTEVVPSEDASRMEVNPMQVRDLVLSIFNIQPVPKFAKVEHPSLTRRAFFIFFSGLDRSRFSKFYDEISHFHELKENDYPLTVQAKIKNNRLVLPEMTLLGYAIAPKQRKAFASYEEMIISEHKLLDNNFPLPPDPSREDFVGMHRFQQWGVEPLSKEILDECRWLPEKIEGANKVIAIDCEMIETKSVDSTRDELARLSVTNEKGDILIDQVFKPIWEVCDLRTHISGITQEMLDAATKNSGEGVDVLATVADRETIIIGHGLENDFKALRLFHTRVVDTSVIYNDEDGVNYPKKPKLINLFQKYMGKKFREEGKSHDSADDARASFELAKYAKENPVSLLPSPPKIPDFLLQLEKASNSIDVLTHAKMTPYSGIDEKIRCHLIDDDKERTTELIRCIKEESSEFVFAHYNGLSRCDVNDEDERVAASYYNEVLEQILPIIPPASVLFIYTGCGSTRRISEKTDTRLKNAEMKLCRQGLLWVKTTPPADEE